MLILRNDPAGMATFTIERVRVLVLPPPIKVEITIKGGDGAKTRLEPLETRQELPGPGGPATWNEAVLAELTAACGIDPEGLSESLYAIYGD